MVYLTRPRGGKKENRCQVSSQCRFLKSKLMPDEPVWLVLLDRPKHSIVHKSQRPDALRYVCPLIITAHIPLSYLLFAYSPIRMCFHWIPCSRPLPSRVSYFSAWADGFAAAEVTTYILHTYLDRRGCRENPLGNYTNSQAAFHF